MIIEFRVGNFRSFREEQVFSMVAASGDSTHGDNTIDCGKFKLLKTAAIYGQNASGKSNLTKAIALMDRFIGTSATNMNLGDPIPGIVPFRLDRRWQQEPSTFEAHILNKETLYIYGFAATSTRVTEEWLRVRRPGRKRSTKWLERTLDRTAWVFGGPLKEHKKLLRERTRENGLVLSRGAELNMPPLADLFRWFRENIWVYDLSIPPMYLMHKTASRIAESKDFRNQVLRMLRDADFGISGINVSEEPMDMGFEDAPDSLRPILKEFLSSVQKMAGGEKPMTHTVLTSHDMATSDDAVNFNLERDESNGTKRFFALAFPILEALKEGTVLVLDEFECSMHPNLSRKLIELFQSREANSKGAQLIFATHDTSLMDSSLFRRDQIWLSEKNQAGATQLFSLYDFGGEQRPRNTEAFEKRYLAGRYGGVPKFGPIFEDLELE